MRPKPAASLALALILAVSATAFAKSDHVFGVHPFKKPTELQKMFTPLINHLEKELGTEITFRSAKNYDAAMDALLKGEVDFSYLGPAGYAILDDENPGKIRVAAAILNKGMPTFKGVIVVKEDAPLKTLGDLRGKKFSFGDRKSTLSCYVPAHMLIKAGVFDTMTYKFTGSHDNVANSVIKGLFDAGGMKPGVAKKYVGKGLRIIAESEPVYEHVIVAGPNVGDETFKKLRDALVELRDDAVLSSIKKGITGFVIVTPSDYDNLKEIIKSVDRVVPK